MNNPLWCTECLWIRKISNPSWAEAQLETQPNISKLSRETQWESSKFKEVKFTLQGIASQSVLSVETCQTYSKILLLKTRSKHSFRSRIRYNRIWEILIFIYRMQIWKRDHTSDRTQWPIIQWCLDRNQQWINLWSWAKQILPQTHLPKWKLLET